MCMCVLMMSYRWKSWKALTAHHCLTHLRKRLPERTDLLALHCTLCVSFSFLLTCSLQLLYSVTLSPSTFRVCLSLFSVSVCLCLSLTQYYRTTQYPILAAVYSDQSGAKGLTIRDHAAALAEEYLHLHPDGLDSYLKYFFCFFLSFFNLTYTHTNTKNINRFCAYTWKYNHPIYTCASPRGLFNTATKSPLLSKKLKEIFKDIVDLDTDRWALGSGVCAWYSLSQTHTYIHIYIHTHTHTYIYIHIHT